MTLNIDCRRCSGNLIACGLCGRTFLHSQSLVEHQRQHTGERPYACPLCPSNYTKSSNLSMHVRKAHGKKLADLILENKGGNSIDFFTAPKAASKVKFATSICMNLFYLKEFQ